MKNVENIIIVYDYAFINGGAAKVAIQSAIELAKTKNVIFFAAVGPACKELTESNVQVICLNIKDINTANKFKSLFFGIWNKNAKNIFLSVLKKYSVNDTIIHFHGWTKALSSSILSISLKNKFKVLITLHDYFCLCPNGGFYDYRHKRICLRKPMSLKCLKCNCDKRNYFQKIWRIFRQIPTYILMKSQNIAFISISNLNEKIVKNYYYNHQYFRIDNPIDLGNEKINRNINNTYLYVGRISEEKGVELFCDILSKLKKKNFNIEIKVVGDGPLLKELKEKYSNINFIGWQDSNAVKKHMRTSRILVFPSKWYEGAPLTIFEALSNDLPCIVSNCTAATEIIKDNYNGLIFKTDDREDLYEKISISLNDEFLKKMKNNIIKDKEIFKNTNLSKHCELLIKTYNIWINK